MTIGRRLALGFGILLVLFAAAVETTSRWVAVARQDAVTVASLDAPLSRIAATIAADVNDTLSDLRGWMIASDPALRQHRGETWAQIAAAAQAMDQLDASASSPTLAAWQAARDLLPALRHAQDEVERIAGSPEEQPAMTLLARDAMPAFNGIGAALTTMINEEATLPATPERKDLLRQMADFRGPFGLSGANMRAYLANGDAPTKALFETLFARARLSHDLLAAHRTLLAPAQAAAFDAVEALWAKFLPLPAAMFRMRESDDWNVARKLMRTEVLPRMAALRTALLGDATATRTGGLAGLAAQELGGRTARLSESLGRLQEVAHWLLAAGIAVSLAVGLLTSRSIVRPLHAMTDVMARLAAGAGDVAVPGVGRRDELGAMAAAVQVFKDAALRTQALERQQAAGRERRAAEDERIRQDADQAAAAGAAALVVGSIGAGLGRLAAGDLTYRLQTALPPAYETLRTDLNTAMAQLQDLVRTIVGNAAALRAGTGEITGAADDLSRRTEQQAASLEQTVVALGQITGTVQKTAQGAKHAHDIVAKTKADAVQSGAVVRRAVTAMASIEQSSQQIGQIIGVIDEIAFQTNLLALNAGVEAARAGEAGRGFAVVASEVRALAQRSAEAAKEIKTLISTSARQVDDGVRLVDETGEALERIEAQVREITEVVSVIALSAQEQAAGLHEVNAAISQMDQMTQQNAAMVEESTAASHSLAQEAEELARLTSRFQLGEAPGTRLAVKAPTRLRAVGC